MSELNDNNDAKISENKINALKREQNKPKEKINRDKIINRLSVDSLRLVFPDSIQHDSNHFEKTYYLRGDEIIKEFKKLSTDVVVNSSDSGNKLYSVKYLKYQKTIVGTSRTKTQIDVLLSAKPLGKNYFDGLEFNSILALLKTQNILKVSTQDLQKALVYDVDFCTNNYLQISEFQSMLETLQTAYKKTASSNGVGVFATKTNSGFVCGSREGAKIERPFLKMYNKRLEASREFEYYGYYDLNKYLNSDVEDLYRLEFTMKDKKMLNRFFHCDNNVLELFSRVKEQDFSVINAVLNSHFDLGTIAPIKGQKLSVADELLLMSLNLNAEDLSVNFEKIREQVFKAYPVECIIDKTHKKRNINRRYTMTNKLVEISQIIQVERGVEFRPIIEAKNLLSKFGATLSLDDRVES